MVAEPASVALHGGPVDVERRVGPQTASEFDAGAENVVVIVVLGRRSGQQVACELPFLAVEGVSGGPTTCRRLWHDRATRRQCPIGMAAMMNSSKSTNSGLLAAQSTVLPPKNVLK